MTMNLSTNWLSKKMQTKVDKICEKHRNLFIVPSPMISLLMDGTVNRARDISEGAKYNNYGIHGTGIATAVDSFGCNKKNIILRKKV